MKKRYLFGLLIAVLGCSTFINHPTNENIVLDCKTFREKCPSIEDVNRMVAAFQDCRRLVLREPFTIHWYDSTHYWALPGMDEGTVAVGYSEWNQKEVYVTAPQVLTHELMHIYHGHTSNDMDVSHAEAPGPWSAADDDLIKNINAAMANGNYEYCTSIGG